MAKLKCTESGWQAVQRCRLSECTPVETRRQDAKFTRGERTVSNKPHLRLHVFQDAELIYFFSGIGNSQYYLFTRASKKRIEQGLSASSQSLTH